MNKQKIIFMVGPDRCGKSHISVELAKTLGVPYFKPSEERQNFLSDQSRFVQDIRHADTRMVDFLRQTQYSVVFDRGFPCEFVYSRFFKRETDMQVLRYIDSEYSKMGATIVVAYRSNYDNVVDDLNVSLTGRKLFEIEELYREFASWTECRVHFLNVDSEALDHQVSQILNFL